MDTLSRAWNDLPRLLAALFGDRRAFLTAVPVYVFVLFVLRLVLFSGASDDDAEQLLYAQEWLWGYKPNQPPLFTWALMAVQAVIGPSAGSVLLVKFAGLGAFLVFFFLGAERALGSHPLAALATLTVMTFFHISWDTVVNYSNSVLLLATIMATVWAALRFVDDTGWIGYATFGAAIGLGLLSKFNYAVFIVAWLAAMAWVPAFRARLFDRQMVLALIFALVIATPFYAWYFGAPEGLAHAEVSSAPFQRSGSLVTDIAVSLGQLVRNAGALVVPGLAILVAVFWTARRRGAAEDAEPGLRLIGIYLLIAAGLAAVLVAGLRVTDVRVHWLFVFMPVPIVVAGWIDPGRVGAARAKSFLWAMAALLAVVPAALIGRGLVAPGFCNKCNFFLPYAELAGELRSAGFDGGTIIAFDNPNILSGNLRRFFPNSRIASPRFVPFLPAPRTIDGKCLIVWNGVRGADILLDGRLRRYASETVGAALPAKPEIRSVSAPLARNPDRRIELRFVLLDGGGDCH